MDVKQLSRVHIKDADQGLVSAVFATLGVVDADADIVEREAVKDGTAVRISAYGHGSWSGVLPVGKGVVRVAGDEAVLDGEFFLGTAHGRDTFETVKQMGDLQEWSFSLMNIRAEYEDQDGHTIRRIKAMDIDEVSPVLKGAGVDTRTLAVKQQSKFSEHAASVLADVRALTERAREVVALRAEKGKGIASESADLLGQVERELSAFKALLEPAPIPDDGLVEVARREFARYVALTQGVTT